MSGLFGGGKTVSNEQERLGNIQIMTSAYGLAIPLVYGRTRIAANIIYYTDFTAIPHTEKQKAGKGGGGGTIINTTYTYTAAMIMALCEGKISSIGNWWRDKDLIKKGDLGGFTFFNGDISQMPWGYLTAKHPSDAVGYGSTAYLAHPTLDLGSSGSTKNHSFEVVALYSDAANSGDASPADIFVDFLTNGVHGAGFPAANIDSVTLADWRKYCAQANIWISPAYQEQKAAAECLMDLAQVTNSALLWSQGLLKIIPYEDQPVGTWTPNTTPLYDLNENDFLVSGSDEDPIQVNRTSQEDENTSSDAYNRIQIEFMNRGTNGEDYNLTIAEATDQANIELYGLHSMDPIQMHMITRPDVARDTAQRILQRSLYIRNTYSFKLGPKYMLLEPMDLVTLTDSTLGLNKRTVRIKEVTEDADAVISVLAEEWPFGIATATKYPPPVIAADPPPNTNVDPGDSFDPVIFEPYGDSTDGQYEVWIATAGGFAWGGCEVWASRDGTTYSKMGVINAPARYGKTTTSMQALSAVTVVAGVDTSSIVGTDLTISNGYLTSASTADAQKFENIIWIGTSGSDGEFMNFQTANLTAANKYDTKLFRRALFGSPGVGHASGSFFVRIDEAIGKIPWDRWEVGDTISIKLLSFNKYLQQLQDISKVKVYTYKLQGLSRNWKKPFLRFVNLSYTTSDFTIKM